MYIHVKEYDPHTKRNEVLIPASNWMNLKNIMQTERSLTQALTIWSDSIHADYPEEVNSWRQTADYWLPEAGRRAEWGATSKGFRVSWWGDENI